MDNIGVVVVIVIGIISFIISSIKGKKRKKDFEELSDNIGFSYIETPDLSLINSWSDIHIFSLGRGKKILNMLTKQKDDCNITLLDYRYTVGNGKNSQTFTQTILMYESDSLDLPSFTLRPENFFHKIGSAFGFKDINFDDYPKFSSQYLLKGKEENEIRETFNPNILDYFTENEKLNVEGCNNRLIYYKLKKSKSLDDINSFIDDGQRVFDLFKEEN